MARRKTGPDAKTVQGVFDRSGECCERCGGRGEQIHHRRARSAGGTRREDTNGLQNLVLLCQADHAFIESNRTWAYAEGWLVRQWADPAYQPVKIRGSWVQLSDTYVPFTGRGD